MHALRDTANWIHQQEALQIQNFRIERSNDRTIELKKINFSKHRNIVIRWYFNVRIIVYLMYHGSARDSMAQLPSIWPLVACLELPGGFTYIWWTTFIRDDTLKYQTT